MLVGRPADEATLLALSAQLEQARPWGAPTPAGLGHHRGLSDGCR
jgi:amidase